MATRPKATAVKQASIEDTNTFLQSLPEKPKEDLSLREAVGQMRESVRAALAKGYTYQELAAMLTEKGVKISAFTLKNYVPSGRRRSTKEQPPKTGAKRGRKSKADIEASTTPATETVETEVPEEALTNPTTDTPEPTEASLKVAEDAIKSAPAKSSRGRGASTTAAKATTASEATVKQASAKGSRSTASKQTKETKPASTTKTSTRGRKKA